MTTLPDLQREIVACVACPLYHGRTHAVPGEGPAQPRVMFIGEGPGFYEDQQARPFVGQAGKFLEELIGIAGLRREDVFITNVVKCRPPNNRDPLPGEMETCHGLWLDRQIALLQPKVIVTLGRFSLGRFFPQETISRARARPRWRDRVLFYPMYHPAAALHQQSLRETILQDMRRLPEVLAQAEIEEAPVEPNRPHQLGMF